MARQNYKQMRRSFELCMPNFRKRVKRWFRCFPGQFRPHNAMRDKNQKDEELEAPSISNLIKDKSMTDMLREKFFVSNETFEKRLTKIKELIPSYKSEIRKLYQKNELDLQDVLQQKDPKFTEVIKLPCDKFTNWHQVLAAKKYRLERQIGRGGYGVVYQIRFQSLVLACKVIDINKFARKKRLIKHLKVEIFVLERCHHPNIITVMDHFIINNHAYIIMEYADGGSLEDLVDYQGPLAEPITHAYFIQITRGLFFLHSCNIAHRDLKLDNVLLVNPPNDGRIRNNVKVVKLSDFGLSDAPFRKNESRIKSGNFGGTLSYMAPEIIRLDVYEEFDDDAELDYNPFVADIWALGVCLFVMLTKSLPFDAVRNDAKALYSNQLNRNYLFPFFSRYSDDVKLLLKRLLEPDPSRRIDPAGIIMHPWTIKYLAKFNRLNLNDGINWHFERFLEAQNQIKQQQQQQDQQTDSQKNKSPIIEKRKLTTRTKKVHQKSN